MAENNTADKRLFLLDAYALIYRSYFAFIKNPRFNSKGMNTSAMYGFVNTLEQLLNEQKPSHIAVVFDLNVPTFRHEMFEAYKANREAMPEDLQKSIPYIRRIIEAYNIPILEKAGFEADDGDSDLAWVAGKLPSRQAWAGECLERKQTLHRKTDFDQVPMKPHRVYQSMVEAFGKDVCYVTTIGLSQIAGAQMLHVYKPRHWINCGQAGPLGWTVPAALGVRAADPSRKIVALSGDYDFQFMIEELAVGAQFKLPYIHIVVNNSYLGLIRQAQRGFEMDYCVQLSFENINTEGDPVAQGYGVDHVKVVEGLGCKAIRVHSPKELDGAIKQAEDLMAKFSVPVVIEVILERVTNIAMGTEIDNIIEFEETEDRRVGAPA